MKMDPSSQTTHPMAAPLLFSTARMKPGRLEQTGALSCLKERWLEVGDFPLCQFGAPLMHSVSPRTE